MNESIITTPRRSRMSSLVRAATRDHAYGMHTYDARGRTVDAVGNHMGTPLGGAFRTHDGRTVDSTGAFLVGELERLDLTLHEPLSNVTWGRDIDLREDVTIADEVSSFTLSTYGSQGSLGTGNGIGNGKAWIGKNTDQISGISTDISKVPHSRTGCGGPPEGQRRRGARERGRTGGRPGPAARGNTDAACGRRAG